MNVLWCKLKFFDKLWSDCYNWKKDKNNIDKIRYNELFIIFWVNILKMYVNVFNKKYKMLYKCIFSYV